MVTGNHLKICLNIFYYSQNNLTILILQKIVSKNRRNFTASKSFYIFYCSLYSNDFTSDQIRTELMNTLWVERSFQYLLRYLKILLKRLYKNGNQKLIIKSFYCTVLKFKLLPWGTPSLIQGKFYMIYLEVQTLLAGKQATTK